MRWDLARLGTNRLDAGLALAFTVAGLVQCAVQPVADGVLGPLYVVGSTLPLAWRRTCPVEAALVSSTFWLIPLEGYPVLGYVVVLLQFFSLGSRGAPRLAVALTTAWASLASVVATLLGPETPVAAIGAVLAVVGPVLVGQVVARLREQNEQLRALTEELRQERLHAEEAAVGSERARIAQELHDVVGHEVTMIAIQAEAAAAALRRHPEQAARPVEAICATAHRTLAQMREVVNVLSPGPDAAEDVAVICRRAEAAGIRNELVVTGAPWQEQTPAWLAVNRIVRECLTNAGRHAPGQTLSVTVAWSPENVTVRTSNRLPGTPSSRPGRGLTGIRHRTELLGGTFAAGRDGEHFEVSVTLPAPAAVRAMPPLVDEATGTTP
jgi:signal transduction histidine kinase